MRKWKQTISPKQLNQVMNVYHGQWMPDMDRCWTSDDGYQVTSRILFTEWGKVEHAAIIYKPVGFGKDDNIDEAIDNISTDGSNDIPWKIKQQIKNEIFGKDRIAIEVFPKESNLVDVSDVYHLWILPKGFKLPFGIHPTKDPQCKVLNRGVPNDISALVQNTKDVYGM